MRAFIAIAFALCIISSTAVTTSSFREARDNEVIAKLNQLQNHPFGKKLLNTIAIELQTSDKVDNVVNVIQGLSAALADQQNVEDADFNTLSVRYQGVIDAQIAGIAASHDEISRLQGLIVDETRNLAKLNEDRESLLAEQQGLNTFLSTLGPNRAQEAAAFLQRQADQANILTGLEAVVQLLQEDANQADDQNYNRESLRNVIAKLNEIHEAVSASIVSDESAETAAAAKYAAFVERSEARLAEIATAVADLDQQIAASEALLASYANSITVEEGKIVNYQTIQQEYTTLLQTLIATHDANTQTRHEQLDLCQQVITILQTRLNNVRTYLGDGAATAAAL